MQSDVMVFFLLAISCLYLVFVWRRKAKFRRFVERKFSLHVSNQSPDISTLKIRKLFTHDQKYLIGTSEFGDVYVAFVLGVSGLPGWDSRNAILLFPDFSSESGFTVLAGPGSRFFNQPGRRVSGIQRIDDFPNSYSIEGGVIHSKEKDMIRRALRNNVTMEVSSLGATFFINTSAKDVLACLEVME